MNVNTAIVPVIINNNQGPKRISNKKGANKNGRVIDVSEKANKSNEVSASPFVHDKDAFLKYAQDRVEIASSEHKHTGIEMYEDVRNFDKREEMQSKFSVSVYI